MVHVHLRVAVKDWMAWAHASGIHAWVLEYLELRSDQLWSRPPKHEEPFSTPRSWHMLSDALHEFGDNVAPPLLEALLYGCLTPAHASNFLGFLKQLKGRYRLQAILDGESGWPGRAEDRDLLYFLAQSFRARLSRDLPADETQITAVQRQFAHRAKALLEQLAAISLEIAQVVVASVAGERDVPAWLLREIVRDLPRLVERRDGTQ
jgi:hypothetical protein